MTALKAQAVDAFLRRPDPAIGVLLIYGEEPDAVREIAARAVKRIAGTLDDPFSVVTLQDGDLGGDPARLSDEVQSLSMFGGNRAIWIKGADQGFLKAAAPILDGKVKGNFIVAEAGNLAKSSQLRVAFEKSQHAHVVAVYAAETGEIAGLVEQVLAEDNLRIGHEAIQRFIELAGTSRGLVRRELEKLSLYCLGASQVSVEDVEAICGNDTGANPDALADSVFQGEVDVADRLFQTLVQEGTDAGRLVMVAHGHVLKLQDFRLAIERGMSVEQALRSARPPIFFRRQNKVHAQLRAWPMAELIKAGTTLAAAVLQTRQNAGLAEAIASRCLLSLSRKGRELRSDRD
jgi:DNA polymerase III subunit delta